MQAASEWLCEYPTGITELLLCIREKYNNPVIDITENGRIDASLDSYETGQPCLNCVGFEGVDEKTDEPLTPEKYLKDGFRVSFDKSGEL